MGFANPAFGLSHGQKTFSVYDAVVRVLQHVNVNSQVYTPGLESEEDEVLEDKLLSDELDESVVTEDDDERDRFLCLLCDRFRFLSSCLESESVKFK